MKLDLPIARPKHPDLVSRASDDFTRDQRFCIQEMINWKRSQWDRNGLQAWENRPLRHAQPEGSVVTSCIDDDDFRAPPVRYRWACPCRRVAR